MDESVKSGARLEVSVSFGRFENDALAWEKWSSFSPNKYLEEVGTLSTPGSVAQKKAYFEAHYKKIAAKKAEEMEQEKSTDHVNHSPQMSSKEDCAENSSEIDAKFGSSTGERLVEEDAQEACGAVSTNGTITDEAKRDDVRSHEGDDEDGAVKNGLMDATDVEEEKEDAIIPVKCEASAIEETKDELKIGKDSSSVELETPQKDSQRITRKPQERENGKAQSSVSRKENPKPNARNFTQKVTPAKKERNLDVTKKKVVSPAVKPLQASTPRYSKPASTTTQMSTSQILKKKGSPLLKSKNSLMGESKRAAPTSLHMSLSLGPANSLSNLSTTRKSLIMEKMGDKDIVKRAFKAFQNRTSGSISDEKPSTVKNVSSTAVEPKMSTFHTPTKGNEGRTKKDAEKRVTPRSQSGTRSNPLPSRSNKSLALDKKTATTFLPITALRSDEKAEKRKEFLKKLEAKSIAREAENAKLSAKSKVGVNNESRCKA